MEKPGSQYRGELLEGLSAIGLSLSEHQIDQLLDYLDLLLKWNKTFNLSGIKDSSGMLSRHLLDSLTLVPMMTGQCILDVGTGPGLPGIPLAICFPEKTFVLLDSNGKKTRFVFQAKLQLGLANVEVRNLRIENFKEPLAIDTIVTRAFSSLADLVTLTEHLLVNKARGVQARILAMKGVLPADELAQLPDSVTIGKVVKVSVPGCEGERHIIELLAKSVE
jgi:16S rRNA (guanine527-N7)-methyltransferase